MIFRQLFDGTSSTYTYLIASSHGGEASIIDPVLDKVDRYLQLVRELASRTPEANTCRFTTSRRLNRSLGRRIRTVILY